MSENNNIFYPSVKDLISFDSLPASLNFVEEGLDTILEHIYYKNFVVHKTFYKEFGKYDLTIILFQNVGISFPGTNGLKLLLNPGNLENTLEIPIAFNYYWTIIRYKNQFNFNSFDNAINSIIEILFEISGTTKEAFLLDAIETFIPQENAIGEFVNSFNNEFTEVITLTDSEDVLISTEEVIGFFGENNYEIINVVVQMFLNNQDYTYDELFNRVKNLFNRYFGKLEKEDFFKILIPQFSFEIKNIDLALQFPRTWLRPIYTGVIDYPEVDPASINIGDVLPEPYHSRLTYNVGRLLISTKKGFEFFNEDSFDLNKSEIGKTGLLLEIQNLKFDFRSDRNIPEATADGRPDSFKGIYVQYAAITLPPKWFNDDEVVGGLTAKISGYNLLIGSGGISGKIALETETFRNSDGSIINYYTDYFEFNYPIQTTHKDVDNNLIITEIANHNALKNQLQNFENTQFVFPLSLTKNGETTTTTYTNVADYYTYLNTLFDASDEANKPRLSKRIGENGFEVWFTSFDMTFQQGTIVESSIRGGLKIPKLKDSLGNPAEIEIQGHLYEDGDFSLTASEPQGIPLNLFDFVTINFLTLELGKQEDKFYIGTSCEITFENAIMKKVLGDQKIVIPRLRVYDDGSIEIVGGNAFIPTNISLNLGPIEIAVTGIHFGSHQQKHGGIMRKYNYWGFDGAISIDPLGVDARGEGIKYYYTTDEGELDENGNVITGGHSFLRIQTIEVDLIIPGSANPNSALAIIHGMVSIPEPGVSQEYIGEVGLKLPKANISGYAKMRLMPKEPAFLIEAGIELPTPIPLAATGLAFYGFGGLLGFRYVAEKEAIGLVSGEDTWYDYYTYPKRGVGLEKFSGPPRTNQYNNPFSIGAGAVIGTMSDDGYLFSTRLMVILSLPSVFILDGRANILAERLDMMGTTEPPFFAGVAVGDNSIEFWFGADYQLPKSNGWIIDLQAEIQAGFFKNNPSGWYVNFGTKENPITAKVLSIITAQSYLMISAQGIEAGARVEFELRKRFGPAKVHIYAYFEMGGHISFERPQIGGYVALGGEIDIDIWIIGITIGLDALLVVEVAEPFLIYAELRIRACIKILWKKICKRFKVKLKWEKNATINRDPIPALPNGTGSGSNNLDRTKELVLGVHMMTNETFELDSFESVPLLSNIKKIIPLDTYIDIKTAKGLLPNLAVNNIGGFTSPAENYVDLIPPNKIVRGGNEVRQVKHKYSIEKIEIKAWFPSGEWKDYHPFKAVVPENIQPEVNINKIGYWQKSGKQYDAIRILATNPFSYTEAGEPGWFIPEQYGITASSLFCEGTKIGFDCSNFLNKEVGTIYYPPTQYNAHFINGAYYTLEGEAITSIIINDDGTQETQLSENRFIITDEPNPHNKAKSLQFNNGNDLVIILPEPSVEVKLSLTTYSEEVTIEYYLSELIDTNQIEYTLIQSQIKTALELQQEIKFNTLIDEVIVQGNIAKIVIKPNDSCQTIKQLHNEITLLKADIYKNNTGLISKIKNQNQKKINSLQKQLDVLINKQESILESNIKSSKINSINVQVYNEIDNDNINEYRFRIFNHKCEIILSSSTRYYNEQDAITELKIAIDRILNYENSIQIKRTVNGKWYFNVINKTGEVIARRIEYFQTEQECLDEINALKLILTNNEILISKNYCEIRNIECIKIIKICLKYDELLALFNNCFLPIKTNEQVDNSIHDCFDVFGQIIAILIDNNEQNISAVISAEFEIYYTILMSIRNLVGHHEQILRFGNLKIAALRLLELINDFANCDCDTPQIKICTTSLQEICWKTIENYEYDLNIPGQGAIDQDVEIMINAINKVAQPIWRPNTAYYIHFQLKDDVDNGENEGIFNYYYGFKTAGPVGHFHNANGVDYGNEFEEGDTNTVINREDENGNQSNNGELTNPDSYPLTSLRQYIDYERSYPNANGNLLKAKPLFYGHEQCKITLFFTKPFVTHMLNNWPQYEGFDELKCAINIMIKDPISNVRIPYPLPVDYSEETVPVSDPNSTSWSIDEYPLIPINLQLIDNFIQNVTGENDFITCELILGDKIVPNTSLYSATYTNLKPQKLYSAIINNVFDADENGTFEEAESIEIHNFVFQTSRYRDFREQVESFNLRELNEIGETIAERQAIFKIPLALAIEEIAISTALDIIKGNSNANSNALDLQFNHLFDRVVEGVLGFKPIDPPISTEFNLLINQNTGDIIGILIRNPEPFNNPNIPIGEIEETIQVMIDAVNVDENYHLLHSNDYSQVIIMNETKKITQQQLLFKFKYKTWNGNSYVVEPEDGVPIDEKKNVVSVNIQINSEN